MGKDPETGTTSMCLRKARGAAAGVKRTVRCEGTSGDQSNKALQIRGKNLDLILMQGRPLGEVTEYSG